MRGGEIWEVQMRRKIKTGYELTGGGEKEAMAVQEQLSDKDVEVHKQRTMMAGSAKSQEAGRFPSVSPPQSQSRKRGPTLPQPKADGVPSRPSTFGGVVYNGQKPGGVAERRGAQGQAHRPAHRATAATHTEHKGDLTDQDLAHPGSSK